MGQKLARSLLQEIRKAVVFSMIADEATDVGNKEQLCMCIQWVDDDFSVNEDFLELIQLPKTDANTVTLALRDSLVRNCLPIGQCRGQAYDGASTFRGHINGVTAQIQQVEPQLLCSFTVWLTAPTFVFKPQRVGALPSEMLSIYVWVCLSSYSFYQSAFLFLRACKASFRLLLQV